MTMTLQTERLVLRQPNGGDADAIMAYYLSLIHI